MLRVAIRVVSLICLMSISAFSQTNFSSRPVGFIKLNVPANGYVLASVPFYMFENGTDEIRASLVSSSNPEFADCLMLWDNSAAKYVTLINSGTNWVNQDAGEPITSFTLLPTEGFIIQNKQKKDKEIYLSGEVVFEEEVTTVIQPSLNLIGYPYSAILGKPAITAFVINEKIELGKGYWVNNNQTNAHEVTENRPYEDLFGSGLPAVSGLKVNNNAADLTIQTAGAKLDIYCQDVTSNEFNSASGWQVLAQDLQVTSSEMRWKDNTVKDISGRYYLICRSDIDLDNSGIPDSRELFLSGVGRGINSIRNGETMADLAVFEGMNDSTNSLITKGSTNGVAKTDKKLRLNKVFYVSKGIGRDTLSGLTAVVLGKDGPKNTIKAALDEAIDRDAIQIHSGHYGENLNIAGKNVTVTIVGTVDLTSGVSVMPALPQVLPSNPTNPPAISQ